MKEFSGKLLRLALQGMGYNDVKVVHRQGDEYEIVGQQPADLHARIAGFLGVKEDEVKKLSKPNPSLEALQKIIVGSEANKVNPSADKLRQIFAAAVPQKQTDSIELLPDKTNSILVLTDRQTEILALQQASEERGSDLKEMYQTMSSIELLSTPKRHPNIALQAPQNTGPKHQPKTSHTVLHNWSNDRVAGSAWYGEGNVSDYARNAIKGKSNVQLPQYSAVYNTMIGVSPIHTIKYNPPQPIDSMRKDGAKNALNKIKTQEDGVVPLLVAHGAHFKPYMLHKIGDEVIIRAMDGMMPNMPKENDAIVAMVREVFPNAKFERSTKQIQHDTSSCGPIMGLVAELSASNQRASANEVMEQADRYIKALSSNSAEAMVLLRKQQGFAVLRKEDQDVIRSGGRLQYHDSNSEYPISREDVLRFERAYEAHVKAFAQPVSAVAQVGGNKMRVDTDDGIQILDDAPKPKRQLPPIPPKATDDQKRDLKDAQLLCMAIMDKKVDNLAALTDIQGLSSEKVIDLMDMADVKGGAVNPVAVVLKDAIKAVNDLSNVVDKKDWAPGFEEFAKNKVSFKSHNAQAGRGQVRL